MKNIMADIETLIHSDSIRDKLIASDLDGTLLWGDLGETVFFLILAMKAARVDREDLGAFLTSVNDGNPITCEPNLDISGVIKRYFAHLQKGQLVQAYSLIDHYLSTSSPVDVLSFSSIILKLGIPKQQIPLKVGDHAFTLIIHAMPDPFMTRLIKEGYLQGAEIRIISGSPQPVVEGYCLFQGLPKRFARGVAKDPDGKVVVPYGRKKLEILAKEGFDRPYIAVGNSPGDFDMLHAAVHPFIRKPSPQEALDEANRNHWDLI
jgi:hypothetical protein